MSKTGFSQEEVKLGVDTLGKYHILSGDAENYLELDEVFVFSPRKFKNKRQRRRYDRLTMYIKKVLPYAKLAGKEINRINIELEKISGEKERKNFIKASEKQLFKQFEKELVKLTYSQGRLLIKLIDRETNNTAYYLIKEFRGSFSAFFWQGIARMFGSNLKSEYDAEGDDRNIEQIIFLIEAGLI